MNITIYTITYNEEKMLPFFLDHYSKFASKIVIYDNESTDNTVKIAKEHPLVKGIYSVKTGDCLDDSMYVQIKNSCWKEDTSDYVMLVDTDELIYHDKDIIEYLEKTKYPVYRPIGFNMVSNMFPKVGSLITEQIKTGIPDHMYNKPVIFNPNLIKKTQFELGIHNGTFFNNNQQILPIQSELKMLHYKNLSFDYRINRHKMFSKRMSEFNQRTGAGIHYTWDIDKQKQEFDNCLIHSEEVI
tara:strand:- start:2018 stop:2743 length:726 start_codon:yes stop_codon:yes gene_type:complete